MGGVLLGNSGGGEPCLFCMGTSLSHPARVTPSPTPPNPCTGYPAPDSSQHGLPRPCFALHGLSIPPSISPCTSYTAPCLTFFEAQQRVPRRRQSQPSDAVSPLLLCPPELDVLVDDTSHAHGDQGVVPGGHKHDGDTQRETHEREGPAGG